MGHALSGLVAAAFGATQVFVGLESRPTRTAIRWWAGYLALEMASGALSYQGLIEISDDSWTGGVFGWLVAGTATAALLRMRVTEIRTSQGTQAPVGLAYFYELVRGFFQSNIDNIGATEQAEWIANHLIPRLKGTALPLMGNVLTAFVQSSSAFDSESRAETQVFVEETINEPDSTDDKKRATLVWAALDMGGWRLLRQLDRLAE